MRLGPADVRRIVREFPRGRGRQWPWIADRDLIIDAEVMDQVRAAWCADSEKPVTPTEIMEFRSELVAALAAKGWV